MIGKSSCSSVAPSLSKRSKVWSTTQLEREPGRSILLMTTMGLRPRARAFLVTKRVCGIGPSTASTSSSTPSTMPNTRSTSPPKSAWPRRVHDVDVGAVVVDGGVLGQNRDATLFFEIVAVHHPFINLLVVAEGTGLAEQLVDECGLAVVNVSDNGDVSKGA
jgi:hypothetical protein